MDTINPSPDVSEGEREREMSHSANLLSQLLMEVPNTWPIGVDRQIEL